VQTLYRVEKEHSGDIAQNGDILLKMERTGKDLKVMLSRGQIHTNLKKHTKLRLSVAQHLYFEVGNGKTKCYNLSGSGHSVSSICYLLSVSMQIKTLYYRTDARIYNSQIQLELL